MTPAPASADSGGSYVFIVTIPGASADSTCAPASERSKRRAVISTSGSSGIQANVPLATRLIRELPDVDVRILADRPLGWERDERH